MREEHIYMANEDLSKLKIDKTSEIYKPRKKRRRIFWVAAFFIIAALGILYAEGIFSPAVKVEVASVSQIYPSQAFTLLNASGYVVAQRKAAVASKVTGRLISLSVEEGSRVKEGQVIARLESDDVAAALKQAEANLNAARHNLDEAKADQKDAELSFNRDKELVAQGFISRAEFDTADARYKKAAAAVAAAQAEIKANSAALQGAKVAVEYTLIRAPFDAVVLTKNADVGDIVTPIGAAANVQAAVVTVADMNSLQVEVDVSESNLRLVKTGQPCEIQLDAFPDLRFRGVVHMIVPTADRSKATVLVKVKFIDKDSRILPEMSAKVAFLSREVREGEQKARTALPARAVVTRNGKQSVFLVQGDRVKETPIRTGETFGDMIEVLGGVKTGDRIAVSPLDKLRDGSRVKIIEK
jgi:RND family efflux transporter MFP subunit